MPNFKLNGKSSPDVSGGWSAERPLWSYADLPVGRLSGSGRRPILIKGLHLFCAGNGANRSVQYFVSDDDGVDRNSASFTAYSGSASERVAAVDAAWSNANGQDFKTGIKGPDGALYIGRASVGGRQIYGTSFTGQALAGSIDYQEVPAAPRMVSVTPLPGAQMRVVIDGSGVDGGGSDITGWTIQYATNSSFTNTVSEIQTTVGTNIISGLNPGSTYYFRAHGKNAVTARLGDRGVWSNVMSAVATAGGKIRRNGVWVDANTKIRRNGSWVDAKVKVRRSGAWKTV